MWNENLRDFRILNNCRHKLMLFWHLWHSFTLVFNFNLFFLGLRRWTTSKVFNSPVGTSMLAYSSIHIQIIIKVSFLIMNAFVGLSASYLGRVFWCKNYRCFFVLNGVLISIRFFVRFVNIIVWFLLYLLLMNVGTSFVAMTSNLNV